ncbi:putative addiction module CopG family antidote [Pararhizobium capsulatum DSM 1112]|uniref:Addiction module CopG family antidote n=1 Tax=Pararhizobium capsulatum DSM 1112 TaxID=1121113 RepID=A0ABU0BNC7_9HYPH|nr:type II toxin-antitoxin system ParD family antitoxin [Pararhizobium capsulatum]MDQ0319751.1 putative addiction module CopG family antidote [Pararhizobium capsulatum DSM 1112]
MNNIHLTDEDRRFVEGKVRGGFYKDSSDVIHAGLQSLQREIELKSLIQEDLDDIAADAPTNTKAPERS